jgi:hypothetical protein
MLGCCRAPATEQALRVRLRCHDRAFSIVGAGNAAGTSGSSLRLRPFPGSGIEGDFEAAWLGGTSTTKLNAVAGVTAMNPGQNGFRKKQRLSSGGPEPPRAHHWNYFVSNGSANLSQTARKASASASDQPIIVKRCRGNAKPLGALRHRRIIDLLERGCHARHRRHPIPRRPPRSEQT